MRIILSPKVTIKLREIKQKDKSLSTKIEKQLTLFSKNPKHPSLRVHKLTGNLNNRWSISISKDLRMIYWLQENNLAYFISIGTHDQVYKK